MARHDERPYLDKRSNVIIGEWVTLPIWSPHPIHPHIVGRLLRRAYPFSPLYTQFGLQCLLAGRQVILSFPHDAARILVKECGMAIKAKP